MYILIIKCQVSIPWAHSLKAKRQVLRSIQDKLRRQFNLSVTEVADHELWQTASIGISYVAMRESLAWEMAEKLQNFVDENSEAEATFTEVVVTALSDLTE